MENGRLENSRLRCRGFRHTPRYPLARFAIPVECSLQIVTYHPAFELPELAPVRTCRGKLQSIVLHRPIQLQFVEGTRHPASVDLQFDPGGVLLLPESHHMQN